MDRTVPGIEVMEASECTDALTRTAVGRLAVDIAGRPEIFPINFVLTDRGLVFRTGAGTKLAGAALMHHVAFEIDGYEPSTRTAWSVIVKGWARELETIAERDEAAGLPLMPWVESDKPNFVLIEIREMTGRRFHLSDDAIVDTSLGWSTAPSLPAREGEPAVVPTPGVAFHPGAPRLHPD